MPSVVKKCKEIDCMRTENASCRKRNVKKSIVCVPKMFPVVKKCKEINCMRTETASCSKEIDRMRTENASCSKEM